MRAAQIMGLRVAGVDMLESDDGPLILEVNSSPGLEGIETTTGLDVAGAIIDFIDNQVAFPELDVRQRLTVSTGYGVAELLVKEGADMVGKPLGDSSIADADISVLSIYRGASGDPQPAPQPRPRSQRPPAVLRPARGDALDDPGATSSPAQAEEAPADRDPCLTAVARVSGRSRSGLRPSRWCGTSPGARRDSR